jgi:hypothetical protein
VREKERERKRKKRKESGKDDIKGERGEGQMKVFYWTEKIFLRMGGRYKDGRHTIMAGSK